MAEFAQALDEINALAEQSPGFIWRLKDDSGNATAIQAFSDPLTLVNLSVWTSVDALREYVYKSMHGKFFARRQAWFEKMDTPHLAMWWIPIGTVPTVAEAKERIDHLHVQGDTEHAFTFRRPFDPPVLSG